MSTYPERNTPLSGVDNAWLRMEDPTNLMMITGLFLFDEMLDMERLKAIVRERLLPFDRFRQRVIMSKQPFARARWQTVPDLDLDDHLHHLTLPAPADKEALEEKVSELMSTQLDFSKPLWEAHLIGYAEGSALVVRLHHCIADGIALIQVILSLTEKAPVGQETSSSQKARPLFMTGAAKSTKSPLSKLTQNAKILFGAPISLLKVAFLPPDPKTPFKGQLGVQKRAAWSNPIPLADIKALGQAKGATINDILLTAATGALRRYMQQEGQNVDGVDMRAVVPVNLRASHPLPNLGNLFGLVYLALPTGVATPDERLKILKERMTALKRSLQPVATFGALYILGFFPHLIQNIILRFFGTKGTTVMTNVPGPRELLYLANSPIRQIMTWVPQSGRLGLGLSILSYNGEVMIGIATDKQLVPNPERLISAFHEELERLSDA